MTEPLFAQRDTDIPPDSPWWARWAWANSFGAIGTLAIVAEQGPQWIPEIKPYVSGPVLHWVTGILALAGIIAKFYRQAPASPRASLDYMAPARPDPPPQENKP
jgi:hypothetical protein